MKMKGLTGISSIRGQKGDAKGNAMKSVALFTRNDDEPGHGWMPAFPMVNQEYTSGQEPSLANLIVGPENCLGMWVLRGC
jgi:hypothetical protein